jgi:hypothetical protein
VYERSENTGEKGSRIAGNTTTHETMPLSNRRRARRKEIQLQETSDAEAPDSSPSRPSAKKRKVSLIRSYGPV